MKLACPACPACGADRQPKKYLCWNCWWELSASARTALIKKGDGALGRLQELHEALAASTPLGKIRISP